MDILSLIHISGDDDLQKRLRSYRDRYHRHQVEVSPRVVQTQGVKTLTNGMLGLLSGCLVEVANLHSADSHTVSSLPRKKYLPL